MGSIKCDRINCKHNKQIEHYSSRWGVCVHGRGYDYGGGDIKINKFGHCVSWEKVVSKK